MALLRIVLPVLVLAGCYSPDLPDCQVVCENSDDCAGDQTCTAGLCTGGAACNGATPDGPPATTDGPQPRTVALRIELNNGGKVIIDGVGECTGFTTPCTLSVVAGEVTLSAVTTQPDKEFDRWTSLKCAGQDAQCTDVFLADATVAVKFD